MKFQKSILLLLFIVVWSNCYSQKGEFSGYIIDTRGNKQTGFVKGKDFTKSQTSVEFKQSKDEKYTQYGLEEIREFGLEYYGRTVAYVKAKVKMDESPLNLNRISENTRKALWYENTLFLEELVRGTASLYHVSDHGRQHFLIKDETGEYKELEYRKFLKTNNARYYTAEMAPFKNLLKVKFQSCTSIESKKYENLSYTKESLIEIFREYNICQGDAVSDYIEEKRFTNQFAVTAGVISEDFLVTTPTIDPEEVNFIADMTYEIGVAYTILFNRSNFRSAFDIAGSFRSTNSYSEHNASTIFHHIDAKYEINQKVFSVRFGLKHKINNNKHMPFFGGGMVLNTYLDTETKEKFKFVNVSGGSDRLEEGPMVGKHRFISPGLMLGLDNTYERFGYRLRIGGHSGFTKEVYKSIRTVTGSIMLTYRLL